MDDQTERAPDQALAGAAIHAPAAPVARPPRSSAMTTFGVLSLILGPLVALGGSLHVGCRAAVQAVQATPVRDPAIARLLQLEMSLWGGMVVLSLALVVIGVGLWRHREVARKAMLCWSVAALIFIAVRMTVQARAIQPHMRAVQHQVLESVGGRQSVPQGEVVLSMGKAWAVWGDLVFWAPYPVLALVLLSRRRARDCCW